MSDARTHSSCLNQAPLSEVLSYLHAQWFIMSLIPNYAFDQRAHVLDYNKTTHLRTQWNRFGESLVLDLVLFDNKFKSLHLQIVEKEPPMSCVVTADLFSHYLDPGEIKSLVAAYKRRIHPPPKIWVWIKHWFGYQ